MSRFSVAALTALVVAVAMPWVALGEVPTVTLDVRRSPPASGCATREQLETAVEERLGRKVFGSASGWGTVAVRYERSGTGGFVAHVLLLDSRRRPLGEREISTEAGHCSALDDSLALVIALLVDEPLLSAPTAEPSPSVPPAEPQAGPQPTPIELPSETHAPRAEWGFEPGGRVVGSWGLIPGVALGVRPRLGLIPPPGLVPVYVDATFYFDTRAREGDAGADFRHWNLGVLVCPRMSLGTEVATLYGCLGQRSGVLAAEGFGFDRNLSPSRLYFSAVLELGIALHVAGPVWVSAGLEGGIPLRRDRFVFARSGGATLDLHRPSPVTLTGVAGAEIRL